MKERGVRRREIRTCKRQADLWRNSGSKLLELTATMLDHYVKGGTFETFDTPGHFYVLMNEPKEQLRVGRRNQSA
jgi:hypothetical protein